MHWPTVKTAVHVGNVWRLVRQQQWLEFTLAGRCCFWTKVSHRWSCARTVLPEVRGVTQTSQLYWNHVVCIQVGVAVSMWYLPDLENPCGALQLWLHKYSRARPFLLDLTHLRIIQYCCAIYYLQASMHTYTFIRLLFVSTSWWETRECFLLVCWKKSKSAAPIC